MRARDEIGGDSLATATGMMASKITMLPAEFLPPIFARRARSSALDCQLSRCHGRGYAMPSNRSPIKVVKAAAASNNGDDKSPAADGVVIRAARNCAILCASNRHLSGKIAVLLTDGNKRRTDAAAIRL